MKETLTANSNEIIGNGAIARALGKVDHKNVLFFASGVANSHEDRESEYDRERDLLSTQDRSRHIVYFSSLVTFFDPDRRYSKHKIEMEEIVKTFDRYTIVRIGNPTWATNPNQLVPSFKEKIAKGEEVELYDEYRHLLGLDEFVYWMNLIPEDRSCEISITGQLVRPADILESIKKGEI